MLGVSGVRVLSQLSRIWNRLIPSATSPEAAQDQFQTNLAAAGIGDQDRDPNNAPV